MLLFKRASCPESGLDWGSRLLRRRWLTFHRTAALPSASTEYSTAHVSHAPLIATRHGDCTVALEGVGVWQLANHALNYDASAANPLFCGTLLQPFLPAVPLPMGMADRDTRNHT